MQKYFSVVSLVFLCVLWSFPAYRQSGGFLLSSPNNLATVCGVVILLACLVISSKTIYQLHVNRPILYLSGSLLLLLFPALWLHQSVAIYPQLIFMVISIWFLVSIARLPKLGMNTLCFCLTIFGVFQVLHSVSQIFWLFHIDSIYFSSISRPIGTFMQVNVLASSLSVSLVAAVYGYYNTVSRAKFFYLASLLLICMGISLAQSRTGYLASLLSTSILAISIRRKLTLSNFTVLMSIVIFGLIFGKLLLISSGEIYDFSSFRSIDAKIVSSKIRLTTYIESIKLFLTYPVGTGFGNFPGALQSHLIENDAVLPSENAFAYMYHPHNEFLLWLVEGGIFSGTVFLYICILIVVQNFKLNGVKFGLIWLSLALPLIIHSMLEFPFYLSFFHWFLFLFFVANSLGRGEVGSSVKVKSIHKLTSVMIVVVALIYGLSGLDTIKKMRLVGRSEVYLPLLFELKNPFILTKDINLAFINMELRAAIDAKSETAIRQAIINAESTLLSAPNSAIYLNLARAYLWINDIDRSQKYIDVLNKFYLKSLNRPTNPITVIELQSSLGVKLL